MVKQITSWIRPLILLTLIGLTTAVFFYNKPFQNIGKAKAAYVLSSSELFSQFEKNTSESLKKYQGKVLEISGSVQTVEIQEKYATVILANEGDFYGINCSFNAKHLEGLNSLVIGQLATIKGECKGYIDDVIINNCVLVKQ